MSFDVRLFNYVYMKDLLTTYQKEITIIAAFLSLPFIVFIIGLSSVYVFGRMLSFVHSPRIKNCIALIIIIGCYMFYFHWIKVDFSLFEKIWYSLVYSSLSILFYVLLGFKLYDRIDHLLDSKIALDTKEIIKDKSKKGKK
jgi:hypothetical protein